MNELNKGRVSTEERSDELEDRLEETIQKKMHGGCKKARKDREREDKRGSQKRTQRTWHAQSLKKMIENLLKLTKKSVNPYIQEAPRTQTRVNTNINCRK